MTRRERWTVGLVVAASALAAVVTAINRFSRDDSLLLLEDRHAPLSDYRPAPEPEPPAQDVVTPLVASRPPDMVLDTSERAGLSPGNPAGVVTPEITPLNAASPARLISPPPHGHDAQALSPHGSGVASDPDIPAPAVTPFPFLLLTQSHKAGAAVTPLNVRDPSALVMPPMAERDAGERIETGAKPPASVPAPVRKAFER